MIDLRVIKKFECPKCGYIFEIGSLANGRYDDELEAFCEDCVFYFEVEEGTDVEII